MKATILVVDDSPTARSVIQVYLASLGCNFLEASSADRALQILRLVNVDLVIADIRMPGTDGVTFVRQVRAESKPWLRTVPIVLLTGDTSLETRRDGIQAGANEFLLKPVCEANLANVVQKYLPLAK
ncbi:MAG: response regulator [Pseudomonadota bacterium]